MSAGATPVKRVSMEEARPRPRPPSRPRSQTAQNQIEDEGENEDDPFGAKQLGCSHESGY